MKKLCMDLKNFHPHKINISIPFSSSFEVLLYFSLFQCSKYKRLFSVGYSEVLSRYQKKQQVYMYCIPYTPMPLIKHTW